MAGGKCADGAGLHADYGTASLPGLFYPHVAGRPAGLCCERCVFVYCGRPGEKWGNQIGGHQPDPSGSVRNLPDGPCGADVYAAGVVI